MEQKKVQRKTPFKNKTLMIGKSSLVFINSFLASLSIAQQYPHKVCNRQNHTHLPQLLNILKNLQVIAGYHLKKTPPFISEIQNPFPYENVKIQPNARISQTKTRLVISRYSKPSYPFVRSRSTPSKLRIVSCKKLKEWKLRDPLSIFILRTRGSEKLVTHHTAIAQGFGGVVVCYIGYSIPLFNKDRKN